jgi:hypothetical protein
MPHAVSSYWLSEVSQCEHEKLGQKCIGRNLHSSRTLELVCNISPVNLYCQSGTSSIGIRVVQNVAAYIFLKKLCIPTNDPVSIRSLSLVFIDAATQSLIERRNGFLGSSSRSDPPPAIVVPIMLVGNQCDKHNREVFTRKHARRLANEGEGL